MKKPAHLLLAFCLILVCIARPQTDKGRFLLGAEKRSNLGLINKYGAIPDLMGIGFATARYRTADISSAGEEVRFNKLNIMPRAGYFLVKNLALGLVFHLAHLKFTDPDDEDMTRSTLMAAGPFARYYIPFKKVFAILEAGIVFGSQTDRCTYTFCGNEEETVLAWHIKTYGGGAGIAVPIGKMASFDAMLGYNSMILKSKGDNPGNEGYILGAFGIRFGFHLYL